MSMNVESFVRSFWGDGADDWKSFRQKFKVLAEIQGWDTEEKRMRHFPLFLEWDAFLVFTKILLSEDKKDKDKVKTKMNSLFSLTKAQAYGSFTNRRLKQDESPDAFVCR